MSKRPSRGRQRRLRLNIKIGCYLSLVIDDECEENVFASFQVFVIVRKGLLASVAATAGTVSLGLWGE